MAATAYPNLHDLVAIIFDEGFHPRTNKECMKLAKNLVKIYGLSAVCLVAKETKNPGLMIGLKEYVLDRGVARKLDFNFNLNL